MNFKLSRIEGCGGTRAVVEAVCAGHGPAGEDVRGGCTTKGHLPPGRRGSPGCSVCTVSRVDLALVAAGAWASRFGFRRLHLESDRSLRVRHKRRVGLRTLPAVGVHGLPGVLQRVPLSRSLPRDKVRHDEVKSPFQFLKKKSRVHDISKPHRDSRHCSTVPVPALGRQGLTGGYRYR